LFGGALAGQGVAIYVTAEDDAIEVQNRLNALGPIPDRLYVLPLPDAGGAVPLFAPDPATRGPSITPAWLALEQQLTALAGLQLIILDPLQPLCALDLNVPENAQFVCSRLAALAASTGASVIVSHHFAKREASTPEQAREAIRGTGGLVDGVRSVYALWNPKEDQAKEICKALDETFERGRVVMGGVVKANGRANLRVTTFLRDARGLLVDRSDALVRARQTPTWICCPSSRRPSRGPPLKASPTPRPAATASMSAGMNCRRPSTPSASTGWPSGWARCSTGKNWSWPWSTARSW
jgi:hypothetical protein